MVDEKAGRIDSEWIKRWMMRRERFERRSRYLYVEEVIRSREGPSVRSRVDPNEDVKEIKKDDPDMRQGTRSWTVTAISHNHMTSVFGRSTRVVSPLKSLRTVRVHNIWFRAASPLRMSMVIERIQLMQAVTTGLSG